MRIDRCNEQMDKSPVGMSSTRRLFSTPVVPDDDLGSAVQNIVTPVTQAGLDPLMHAALQTPPLSITPTCVETPPGESYTHVSMFFFVVLVGCIWKLTSCWSFIATDSGSISARRVHPKAVHEI
jgi:hypothetical protein